MNNRVFLSLGNEQLEQKLKLMSGLKIVDSESNLDILKSLLEFIEVDYLIINRLLDEDGSKIIEIAEEAKKCKIKIILIVDDVESYIEKKLITKLISQDVYAYVKVIDVTEENLLQIINNYPKQFDFSILKSETDSEWLVKQKIVHVGFKKLVLTVWDNAEFGCELAYTIAKHSKHSVMLIDLDLLAPKADMILNVPKYPEGIRSEGIYTRSGLNILLDAIEKGISINELIYEASVRKKDNRNLYILTGNYDIKNYEYYNVDSLKKLIELSYSMFDITILLVNKSIYDEFTSTALQKSDYNILAIKADLPTIREYNSYLMFLKEHKHIPLEKTKFIAYEYLKSLDIELGVFKEITEKNLIGSIGYCKRRQSCRNKKLAYARKVDTDILYDYIKLLKHFRIVVDKNYKDKLKDKMAEIKQRIKKLIRSIKSKN